MISILKHFSSFCYVVIIYLVASFLRLELFLIKYLFKNKFIGIVQIIYLKLYKIKFGKKLYFNEVPFILSPGNIIISDNCSFGEKTRIYNHTSISIGKNFLGAPGLTILTGGHDPETLEGINKPIVIGENCWCGYNVTILPGVTIGDNVSIGSCSIVTRSIESNSIAVGSPARVVRKFKANRRHKKTSI